MSYPRDLLDGCGALTPLQRCNLYSTAPTDRANNLYEFRKREIAYQRKVGFKNKLVEIILRISLSHLINEYC